MVILNLRDGGTREFDLSRPEELKALNQVGRDPKYIADNVTALWIKTDRHSNTLPLPRKYKRITFWAETYSKDGELIRETVFCQADNTELAISAFFSDDRNMTRLHLNRVGKPRFTPDIGGQA